MLDFLDPFWKWLFLGVDLDYFVNSSEYREGWWKYATTTYLGWLLGIGSVIMFVGLVMFAGLCGARRATFMTMLFVFLFILACTILADYYLPQIWASFKRSISKRISQGSSYLLFEFMNEQIPHIRLPPTGASMRRLDFGHRMPVPRHRRRGGGGPRSLMLLSSLVLVLVGLELLEHDEPPHTVTVQEGEHKEPNAAAAVEYDELTGEHDDDDDDESQVRRLNIWKFLGDQGEKFGVKVFNKYLGGKYLKVLVGLKYDRKSNKVYFKSLRWARIRLERLKVLKMRDTIDNSWFLGFFYKWPRWMMGFGSFFFIIFLVFIYKFYGLKHVAAFMVLAIILIFMGAFFHFQRVLEDVQYHIAMLRNAGLWSFFLGKNPIDAVKGVFSFIGRIF
ncbi:hypothetical protein FOZ63_028216 [Perkinsus olseni]|uniref:Uncharacterized protein n=1 Tax=Perkinsus olseni TaxID=32597 RepID=A0A7J6UPP3_PEROL|nr:hypothetical protein FOZ63_028216 [Perkinsus olseni]